MLMAYAMVAVFFLVAAGFVAGALLLGRFIRPNKMYPQKLATYECGEEPVGPAWFNFNPRFYVVALIFIVFDVEIAFIYPVARVFKTWVNQGLGWFAFVEIFSFIAVLIIGLAYVWLKGDLEWIRAVKGDPRGAQGVTARARAAREAEKPLDEAA
jgi:NADH-quinone oxidoreductase subunit A